MKRCLVLGAALGLVLACGDPTSERAAAGAPAHGEASGEGLPGRVAGEAREDAAGVSDAMIGVVVPEAEVVLVAAAQGRIEWLDVRVGTAVSEGQILAKLDVHRDVNDLAAAKAAFRVAQAELEHIELELARAKVTRSETERLEGIVSQAEAREHEFAEQLAAAKKRSAGASILARRSQIDEAAARIAEAELRAPFDGVVTRRHLDPGATVSPHEPVLELVSNATRIRFASPVVSNDVLAPGRRVWVTIEGEDVLADVVLVAPEVEPGLGLVLAEARVIDRERPAPRVGTEVRLRWAEMD